LTPHYTDHSVTLHHGDCLDILRQLPDNSVDAVVTDPPYGLEFMGKDWDRFKTGRGEKYAAGGALTHTEFKKLGALRPILDGKPA
jgi:DNA modification methylase